MIKKSLSVLIALTLLLLSIPVSSLSAYVSTDKKQYSGEELLKGIIFGTGDAAKELTDVVWTKEEYELNNDEAVVKEVDILVNEIDKIDPTYLERLERNIYSENYIEVEKNFTELNDLLDKAIKNLDDSNKLFISEPNALRDGAGLQATAIIGPVAYAAAAVTLAAAYSHAAIATVANAAAAHTVVYAEKYLWGPNSGNKETTQLVKEDFVDKVVSAYN